MSRIAYRALVLLICSVVCVGLIAARPLPSYPAAPDLQRYDAALLRTLPDRHGEAGFRVFLDATLALMRGLAMTRAVDGARVVDRRWQAIKPHLLALAAR